MKNKRINLTQEELIEQVEYNPNTGQFIRIKSYFKNKIGTIANFYHKESGYYRIKINGVGYQAHILAWVYMTGKFPENEIDHIDMNRSNNKWENLREATSSQNLMNRKIRPNNKTGYVGVSYKQFTTDGYAYHFPYTAKCTSQGVSYYLGTYKTAKEASDVYEKFAKDKFGEFYRNPEDR